MQATRFKFWLWLIRLIGVIVPRRIRSDWQQEWEAELSHREAMLAEWDRLNWRTKFDLTRRSLGAFRDALWMQSYRWEDEMIQDIRFGLRMLLKSPAFTFVAVITLALGIGVNTAIFSVLDAVILKSLPVQEPEKLVLFGSGEDVGMTNSFPNKSWDLFSYPFYKEVEQRNEAFSAVTGFLSLSWDVHGTVNTNGTGGEMKKMEVQLVSGSYFATLGVSALIGRTITEEDDLTSGAHPVVVVSYGWWESNLGGDPSAVGKTITIDQTVYTIIGIAPREFLGTTALQSTDIWMPLAMEPQLPPGHWDGRNKKDHHSLYLIGRLKDGVSTEQASAAVNLLFKQSLHEMAGTQPSAEQLQDIERASIQLTPGGKGLSGIRDQFSLSLQILMAVVGLVLLIACANVANLLMARATARQKEFAVRLAVGANRLRLIRQSLTESILLASLGGIAGVMLAWWGSRMLVTMASSGSEPLPVDVTPNARLLGFTLLASLLSAVIFGTVPSLYSTRIEPNSVLKAGKGAMQFTSQSRLGKALVVVQVALSLLLLVGAGLFVRTLINLQSIPTGFNQQNVLLFTVDTTATGYELNQLAALQNEVEEKVKAVPGVQAASFSFFVFNQGQWTTRVFTRENPTLERQNRMVSNIIVGRDYFAAMGIPVLLGRGFGPQDTANSQNVALVSETMAQRFFPNVSPIGRRFGRGSPENSEQFEVIGVVKDTKIGSLTEKFRAITYYPYTQQSGVLNNIVVRFSGAPESVVPQVRQAIGQVNQNLPIDEVVSLSEHVGRSLVQQRLIARLASFFGLLALMLACVGLYGVLSYAVARRTNEIGIRIALGAKSSDVRWMVLREALKLVFIGTVIGLGASLLATRTASALLFELKPNDPLTITLSTLLLLTIATLAAYLPARRATKVDPLTALRHE